MGPLWLLAGALAAVLLFGRREEEPAAGEAPAGSEELDVAELEAAGEQLEDPPAIVFPAVLEPIQQPGDNAGGAGAPEAPASSDELEELDPAELERTPAPEVAE